VNGIRKTIEELNQAIIKKLPLYFSMKA